MLEKNMGSNGSVQRGIYFYTKSYAKNLDSGKVVGGSQA